MTTTIHGDSVSVFTMTLKVRTADPIFAMDPERMHELQRRVEVAVGAALDDFEMPLRQSDLAREGDGTGGVVRDAAPDEDDNDGAHYSDVESVDLVDVRDDTGQAVYVATPEALKGTAETFERITTGYPFGGSSM